MRKCLKAIFKLVLISAFISGFAAAVDAGTDPVWPEEAAFPPLNSQGFLEQGEFLYENDELGLWRYVGAELRVEICRYTQKSPARTWFEAEIFCAEGAETPHMIPNDPEKWLTSTDYPHKIARKNGTVIAISSDYAQLRLKQKIRMGIIIRGGTVFSERTWRNGASKFPNLDTLAIWPDGDMKVFNSDEKTAEEYLAEGVTDVLAFGPWLIRDGELNTQALAKYGKSKAQRVAVGMVDKGHYWFMMLEGRITRSKGDGISFLAEKLMDRGCTQAMNLDGGQTACIVFMGHQLCKVDNSGRNKGARVTADILGVGTSPLVRGLDDPW